jgi:hypothetical protein
MASFAPIALAKGSSIKNTVLAPAFLAASRTAFLSTSVTPQGMPIITLGKYPNLKIFFVEAAAFSIKYFNICSVTSKSEITPFTRGLVAVM